MIFGVITLDEGYHVGILFRGEAAYGYSWALTLVSVLPELPVGGGKVEGRENLPFVLFYSGFEIGRQVAEAVFCSGVRGNREEECGEEEFGEVFEAHCFSGVFGRAGKFFDCAYGGFAEDDIFLSITAMTLLCVCEDDARLLDCLWRDLLLSYLRTM